MYSVNYTYKNSIVCLTINMVNSFKIFILFENPLFDNLLKENTTLVCT